MYATSTVHTFFSHYFTLLHIQLLTCRLWPLPRQWQQTYWLPRGGSASSLITRGAIVRTKIAALRAASSPSNPICFKCADRGHTVSACRNVVLCFLCNQLGHRSSECRSVTNNPPTPRKSTLTVAQPPIRLVSPVSAHTGALPPSCSPIPPLLPLNSASMSSHAMRAPIRTLFSTEASDLEEQAFHRSFFLTDHLRWGPIKIEQALKKLVSYFGWFASKFDEHRYLIEAPNPQWLEATLTRGHVLLDNIQFRVSPWDPCYSEGLRMIPQWVKVRGFPAKFWQWEEFEKIFSDFGATVLELDHATRIKRDRQVARLRLGMCDPLLLPSTHWVMHRDSGGYLSRFDLIFELEPAKNAGSGAWAKKGQTNDPVQSKPGAKGVVISEKSGSSQNTRKAAPIAGTGKGKAVAPADEDDHSDSEDEPVGLIAGLATLLPGNPSHTFFPTWIPDSYGPGSGRNPSSYAPYCGEELGPFEEIEVEPPPAPKLPSDPNILYPNQPTPSSAIPAAMEASPTQVNCQASPPAPYSVPSSPTLPGSPVAQVSPPAETAVLTDSSDSCWRDNEGLGLIPHVSVEPLPHREVILHTPQGDFQCHSSEVLDTLTSQVPRYPSTGQQAADTLQAIHAIAALMTQLVTPLLPHPPPSPTSSPAQPAMATTTPVATDVPGSSRKRRAHKSGGFPQPRRSVRIISQGGGTIPVLDRATARVQSKYNLRSGAKGLLQDELKAAVNEWLPQDLDEVPLQVSPPAVDHMVEWISSDSV